MSRTLGIMGGMGPEATASFYSRFVQLTPAAVDQEHHPVVIFSDPTVPDRTEYILGRGPSPLPALLRLARKVESAGADLLAIPCNTAHLFWSEIAESVEIPVLNILDETVREIGKRSGSGSSSIGVLATVGTIRSKLYQEALSAAGYKPLIPPEHIQHEVHECIRKVKAQTDRGEARNQIEAAVALLARDGAQGVILGCTELGLAGDLLTKIPVFDSLQILVAAALREVTGS
jgi:aspartate racemase